MSLLSDRHEGWGGGIGGSPRPGRAPAPKLLQPRHLFTAVWSTDFPAHSPKLLQPLHHAVHPEPRGRRGGWKRGGGGEGGGGSPRGGAGRLWRRRRRREARVE